MKIDKNTDMEVAAAQPARDIPLPPGGGSWRFDEALWEWIDINPQPQAAAQPSQE